jgi:hypothetical protein
VLKSVIIISRKTTTRDLNMPILDKTSLNASDKLDFLLNSLACQAHGAISQLSSQVNISRKTIYATRDAGIAVLEALLSQIDTVRQVKIDEPHLRRTIVSLSIAAPCSIRAIENLIPMIYPGVTRRFGYIQALQVQAQYNAAIFNRQVDLSPVNTIAPDEVFCQNEPVLAAIDLDSGFLTSLSHETHRDGATWSGLFDQGILQGMMPSHVVKDGGLGMKKAVKDPFPDAEQRDDVFHALHITSKAVFKVEKRAYLQIAQEVNKILALKNGEEDEKEDLRQALEKTIQRCNTAIANDECAEKAMRLLHRALSSVHSNEIELMSPEAAQSLLALSAHLLLEAAHPDCDVAARYINNRLTGLTLATASFYQEQRMLCEHYPEDLVALSCYYFEFKRSLKKMSQEKRRAAEQKMLGASHCIYRALSEREANELMDKVEQAMDKRHRASSAIEGFNAILRPYMYVRKGVSQRFLELFQAWHNRRTRRCGKRAGTSAYEDLTGNRVDDWLTMIGFPPSSTIH